MIRLQCFFLNACTLLPPMELPGLPVKFVQLFAITPTQPPSPMKSCSKTAGCQMSLAFLHCLWSPGSSCLPWPKTSLIYDLQLEYCMWFLLSKSPGDQFLNEEKNAQEPNISHFCNTLGSPANHSAVDVLHSLCYRLIVSRCLRWDVHSFVTFSVLSRI